MKILKTKVRRYPENRYPRFEVDLLVDKIPDMSEMRFERKGTLWFCNHGGYVRYFGWTPPNNNGGYYGRSFDIKMKNGEEVTLLGPWSSRSSEMNKAGFVPSLEVGITDEADVWERDGVLYAGAVTVEILEEALGEKLIEVDSHGEPMWVLRDA